MLILPSTYEKLLDSVSCFLSLLLDNALWETGPAFPCVAVSCGLQTEILAVQWLVTS